MFKKAFAHMRKILKSHVVAHDTFRSAVKTLLDGHVQYSSRTNSLLSNFSSKHPRNRTVAHSQYVLFTLARALWQKIQMLNFINVPLFYFIKILQNVFPNIQLTSCVHRLYTYIVVVVKFVEICFVTVCYSNFVL